MHNRQSISKKYNSKFVMWREHEPEIEVSEKYAKSMLITRSMLIGPLLNFLN